ncbi:MAG: winged helix-turn-helix transcriptional regulator, partial [Pseudomonadota bacterium]
TEYLRSLERDGYITRRVDPGPPIAVFYELTEMGEGLVEKLKLLVFWAGDHYTPVMNARASYEERVGPK